MQELAHCSLLWTNKGSTFSYLSGMSSNRLNTRKKLVVVGAGAAGYFCALHAAAKASELEIIILEKSSKGLSKVKVSGGGRCNVTHQASHWQELLPAYPRGSRFLKRTLSAFSQADTQHWFESRGVPLKTESDGRMFPESNSSQSIVDCLEHQANLNGIQVRYGAGVIGMHPLQSGGFNVVLEGGESVMADAVCVACGGLAKPQHGIWLEQMGVRLESGVPSLFTFQLPAHPIVQLQGVAIPKVRLHLPGFRHTETGPLLITHWGFSGPAVLRLSAWAARYLADCSYHHDLLVNWLPDWTEDHVRSHLMECRLRWAGSRIGHRQELGIPMRLWQYMVHQSGIALDHRWADLSSKALNTLVQELHHGRYLMHGKTTFKEEFVTCGGVDLSQVDPLTMACKQIPGLFFAGEVLDVDGITGGYNFQHAWSSGAIAGKAIADWVAGINDRNHSG